MTTTRRLSGMQQGAGHQSTSLMLETYEAFKRKHLSQNKEIIQKNSELHKTNADLQRQISLMRAERLSLKGTQFQLECENAALRDRLDRADDRERQLIDERDRLRRSGNAAFDHEQVEAMRKALSNALAALQAFGLMLPSGYTPLPSPVARAPQAPEPESPLNSVASTSTAQAVDPSVDPGSSVPVSRRHSLAARVARPSMVTPPDLSNISEGGSSAEDEGEVAGSMPWGRDILPEMHASTSSLRTSAARVPPTASTSHAAPANSPSPASSPTPPPPALSRPARAPRAPPKAPSAASHDSLASARPKRRISGMLRPGLASAGMSEFGMAEEDEDEGERDEGDDGAAYEPQVTVAPRSAARGKRRASALIAVPVVASSGRATRSGRTPTPEPEPAPPPAPAPRPVEVEVDHEMQDDDFDGDEEPRPALWEIQPAPAPKVVPSTAGKGKGRAKAAPAAEQEDEELPLSSSRGSALLKARKDAVRNQRAVAVPALATAGDGDLEDVEAEASTSSLVVEETLSGSRSRARAMRRMEELDPLHEEIGDSQPSEQSEEGAVGRRARKSVNYALPKLNTKMRRPEDYVPIIKHVVSATHAKPRKSTRAPSSSSSTSSSAPPYPPPDAPAARPASLAGKKPRISPAPDPTVSSDESNADADAAGDDDAWSEKQFLRRVSSARPSAALGQDVEERRRARQAIGKGAAAAVSRRHSVAV